MEQVQSAKYLGITISDDLDWGQHISEISSKATKTLGFLRCNLAFAPRHTKEAAYKTLVRPKLEYAAPIWHPYHETQIGQVEKVQRTAARCQVAFLDASAFMCCPTLKIGKILFIVGFFLLHLGKKTYFLALGTIPVTGVGFIARKITVQGFYFHAQTDRESLSFRIHCMSGLTKRKVNFHAITRP